MDTPFRMFSSRFIVVAFLVFIGWMWVEHRVIKHVVCSMELSAANLSAWVSGLNTEQLKEQIDATDTTLDSIRRHYNVACFNTFGRGHKIAVKGRGPWVFYHQSVSAIPRNSVRGGPFPELFEKLDQFSRLHGYRMAIMPILPKSVVHRDALTWNLQGYPGVDSRLQRYLNLMEEFEARGIDTISWPGDSPEDFLRNSREQALYHKADPHWNDDGASLAASRVVDYLRQNFEVPSHTMAFKERTLRVRNGLFYRLDYPVSILEKHQYQHTDPVFEPKGNLKPAGHLFGTSFSFNYRLHNRISRAGGFYVQDHSLTAMSISMVIHSVMSMVHTNSNASSPIPLIIEFPTRLLDRFDENGYLLNQLDYAMACMDKKVIAYRSFLRMQRAGLRKDKDQWILNPKGGHFILNTELAPEIQTADFLEFDIRVTQNNGIRGSQVKVVFFDDEGKVFYEEAGLANLSRDWQTWRFPLAGHEKRPTKVFVYPGTERWHLAISNMRFK